MSAIASQITSLTIVYSTVYSDADQRKHQSSASLAFVRGIHRGPVNSPHKGPVTRKMFPFDDVIIVSLRSFTSWSLRFFCPLFPFEYRRLLGSRDRLIVYVYLSVLWTVGHWSLTLWGRFNARIISRISHILVCLNWNQYLCELLHALH